MKKNIYAVLVPLVLIGGLVIARRETKSQTPKTSKPAPVADGKNARATWEATPDGLKYKEWETSPAGQKVLDGAAKIRTQVRDSSNMEAVITSLTLPPGTRLGFAVMASIGGTAYILRFDTEKSQLAQLRSLKANDNVIIKGRGVSMAPKYDYPILSVSYLEKDGKMICKRIPPKGGC